MRGSRNFRLSTYNCIADDNTGNLRVGGWAGAGGQEGVAWAGVYVIDGDDLLNSPVIETSFRLAAPSSSTGAVTGPCVTAQLSIRHD